MFSGIPLDKVCVHVINARAVSLLAMYRRSEKSRVSPNKLQGTVQNDI